MNGEWHTEHTFELLPQRWKHTGQRFPFFSEDCAFAIRSEDYTSHHTPSRTRNRESSMRLSSSLRRVSMGSCASWRSSP